MISENDSIISIQFTFMYADLSFIFGHGCDFVQVLSFQPHFHCYLYAVKVQKSLAPLSRFRGSHIPSAHEQQCCRFVMRTLCDRLWNLQAKFTLREPHSWDPRQRTTWSQVVTSDFNSVLPFIHELISFLHDSNIS